MYCRAALTLLFLIASLPLSASGQTVGSALASPERLRAAGLERMWFTQLGLNAARGRVAGVHQHVSGSKAHTVFQIIHDGKRYVYSERDRNAFGEMIGVEAAKLKAEEQLAKIKSDLEAAGVKEIKLPEIQMYVVPEITLYATSERGLVHAIDGETGRTIWTASVGSVDHPTTAAAANDTHVAVLNGSMLYVLTATDGEMVWSKYVVGAPGAAPAMSETLIFVPMLSGAVESYAIDNPKRPVAIYQSFGRTMVQPVVSMNSVAWPTDRGNLYVGHANAPGMRFRLEAKKAINAAPAFLAPNKVLATSLDGYIYCVNEQRGTVIWRFTTGDPITHSPIALGDTVYAITDRGNMFAVRVSDAAELWITSGIRNYVAGNERRLYCMDTAGNLVILDTASGSQIGLMPMQNIDLRLMNVQTDRLLLATSTGLLQSIRESDKHFPVVHYLTEAPGAATPGKPAEKPMEPMDPAAEPMPSVDPAADPFAAPAAAAPAGEAPAADPFATP